jgi:SAM-dependent methyltransferase
MMQTYQADTYGEWIAGVYDEWYPQAGEAAITTLSELAHGGRALELGIGSGRIALPLQRRGVQVAGIDASAAMLARLRSKPSAERIPVTLGDFADVEVEGQFTLIYVVFNTFFALLTQEAQVRCFQNVARHLTPAGVFVVEAFVPDLSRYAGGQSVRAGDRGLGEVQFDVSHLDPLGQQITSQHVVLSEGGIRIFPVKLRYAWPAELDLMAQLAGMSRKHRWSNWERAPFTADSASHISVYELGRAAA